MSICGMNGKFYAYFCNKKFSVNNFGAKIEASGDPGWWHMGIQNHVVEVNARVHQKRSGVVFGSHGKKKTICGVTGSPMRLLFMFLGEYSWHCRPEKQITISW